MHNCTWVGRGTRFQAPKFQRRERMVMTIMEQLWPGLASTLTTIMLLLVAALPYLPPQLGDHMTRHARILWSYIYPYIEIKIPEYTGERFSRSRPYIAIQAYLTNSTSESAKKLKAEIGKDSDRLVYSMDDNEQVTDNFRGARFWWTSKAQVRGWQTISLYRADEDPRFYQLTFHRRHRKLVMDHYMNHVMEEGKAVMVKNRQKKLYTNCPSSGSYGQKQSMWSHVAFEHPATFKTLAMDPDEKQDIIEDLTAFRDGKDYYSKIGKAWKRGYLLYGPPGTGKSSMVAAMANFLDYDVYDLELTSVKNNTELRRLLIETTSKSIMVIEDIDCSSDLSGKRKKNDKKSKDNTDEMENAPLEAEKEEPDSKVTLSGLLNVTDGLWSASAGERLIVFTTNHVEKLDKALIRRGRMDKHIELSHCSFKAFKLLAKNYLGIDSHPLFKSIEQLMEEAKIIPVDVAENLMSKSSSATAAEKADQCLEKLIQALQAAKEAQAQLKENSNEETPIIDKDDG